MKRSRVKDSSNVWMVEDVVEDERKKKQREEVKE